MRGFLPLWVYRDYAGMGGCSSDSEDEVCFAETMATAL